MVSNYFVFTDPFEDFVGAADPYWFEVDDIKTFCLCNGCKHFSGGKGRKDHCIIGLVLQILFVQWLYRPLFFIF